MNILAVIPARGGSKGIPRKNIRLMNGQPLIAYSINNAIKCNLITDIVVTTDDEEIAQIAKLYGAQIVMRPKELGGDTITLDPVIYDATIKMEQKLNKKYDIVITLQATSPLLKSEILKEAIEEFCNSQYDTYISATNKPHLSWGKNEVGYYPLYEKRLNRQQLPPNYLEAGAFLITKREYVKENSRMGQAISVYEIPEEQAVDIDSVSDWIVCESVLKKKKIVLRCDGHKDLGMGHIYHCLTLAYNLTENDIMLVTNEKYEEGVEKIKSTHLNYKTIKEENEFFQFLEDYKPDIVVIDCLDTKIEYIKRIKTIVDRVVTIEDLGEGAQYADAVINALYKEDKMQKNMYSGEKYVSLREEFLISSPKEFSTEVSEVLVLFGGTDPSNLTEKIYDVIKNCNYSKINFTFALGIGYNNERIIDIPEKRIKVLKNIKNISVYMKKADIAFTSQGRTIYELAVLGVPSIVLAQNEREQLHTFAQMNNGFLNLGLGKDVSEQTIQNTFDWLVKTPYIRKEMRQLMLKKEIKNGLNNEIKVILGK